MAGTFNYLYDPQQSVWVIDTVSGVLAVRPGVIVRVKAEALMTGASLAYDIRVGADAGTKSFVEADVFGLLDDATTEYETRLV